MYLDFGHDSQFDKPATTHPPAHEVRCASDNDLAARVREALRTGATSKKHEISETFSADLSSVKKSYASLRGSTLALNGFVNQFSRIIAAVNEHNAKSIYQVPKGYLKNEGTAKVVDTVYFTVKSGSDNVKFGFHLEQCDVLTREDNSASLPGYQLRIVPSFTSNKNNNLNPIAMQELVQDAYEQASKML